MTYLHPVAIGEVTLAHNIVFAPMAGVSDLPFRLLCREQGAAMVSSELISAKAITYGSRNTFQLLETQAAERPVAIQLFGSEPYIFAEAAKRIDELPFDILDINMGCPVHKVVKCGEGAALMKNPLLIEVIVRETVQASSRPVTVKLRAGFDAAHVNAAECAKAAEAGGASMVAIHARTREQYYSGSADWSVIRAVKAAVSVPVFGNGDVTGGPSALKMLKETGCDAVMIGRAARGNPFVFREILSFLQTGEACKRPDKAELLEEIYRHIDRMIDCKGEAIAVREMRKHIAWYTTGMTGAAKLRARVNEAASATALRALVDEICGADGSEGA